MASEPPPAQPASTPPPQAPGPGASRDEWRAWRHQQRDYMRESWYGGSWYGPWAWGGGRFWGPLLLVIGAYFLLQNLGLLTWLRADVLWPVLLILLGVWLLLRRGRSWWR